MGQYAVAVRLHFDRSGPSDHDPGNLDGGVEIAQERSHTPHDL
jgi:hypothetical protein